MWQQAQDIVEYTSIYNKNVVPTQEKKLQGFFYI